MFLGIHHRTLDAKGRLILPLEVREALEGGGCITRGPDNCLVLFKQEDFDSMADDLAEKAKRGPAARKAVRAFYHGAARCQPDRQGRIAIPEHLRSFARLGEQVVVGGVGRRIEVWNADEWASQDAEGMALLAQEQIDVHFPDDKVHDIGI